MNYTVGDTVDSVYHWLLDHKDDSNNRLDTIDKPPVAISYKSGNYRTLTDNLVVVMKNAPRPLCVDEGRMLQR